MHAAFNAAASFVPSSVVQRLAEPPMIDVLNASALIVLFAPSPGRFLTTGECASWGSAQLSIAKQSSSRQRNLSGRGNEDLS